MDLAVYLVGATVVTFMVHSSGSQPPLEEQNAAISPCGSMTGFAA